MSAVIPPAVAAQILAKVDASNGTDQELDRIRKAAEAAGNPDGRLARLKPGPKRNGEDDDVVKRMDVARCRTCHTHHDAEHVCPHCGSDTPDTAPAVQPWVIRQWAIDQGMAPVPSRGTLPARILDAYTAAHTRDEAAS